MMISILQSIQEAQCLANQVELYYCNPSPAKQDLLVKFSSHPDEFRHHDLIAEMENIALLPADSAVQ